MWVGTTLAIGKGMKDELELAEWNAGEGRKLEHFQCLDCELYGCDDHFTFDKRGEVCDGCMVKEASKNLGFKKL